MQLFWQHLMAAKEDAMIRIGEFKKIAEILVDMVAGSDEDERLFSAMSFVLTKHRCSLRENLEKCVRLMTQELFSIDTFPWGAAMEWRSGMLVQANVAAMSGTHRTACSHIVCLSISV
jgi:hypothetical protein